MKWIYLLFWILAATACEYTLSGVFEHTLAGAKLLSLYLQNGISFTNSEWSLLFGLFTFNAFVIWLMKYIKRDCWIIFNRIRNQIL